MSGLRGGGCLVGDAKKPGSTWNSQVYLPGAGLLSVWAEVVFPENPVNLSFPDF